MGSPEREVDSLQAEYTAAASAFVSHVDRLLQNELTHAEILQASELWDRMESSDASARSHYNVALHYDGQTHIDRFDDHRMSIDLCLRDVSRFFAPGTEEADDDVTDDQRTGMCTDAGQADDLEGK